MSIHLIINHIQDFRNYKVSVEKAKTVLSFHPSHDLKSIVADLIENIGKCQDWDNPLYSNIGTFRSIESALEIQSMAVAV